MTVQFSIDKTKMFFYFSGFLLLSWGCPGVPEVLSEITVVVVFEISTATKAT